MSLISLRSPIRCSVNLISHSWLTPVEERLMSASRYPVYVGAYQPVAECVQCIVLASPGLNPRMRTP